MKKNRQYDFIYLFWSGQNPIIPENQNLDYEVDFESYTGKT